MQPIVDAGTGVMAIDEGAMRTRERKGRHGTPRGRGAATIGPEKPWRNADRACVHYAMLCNPLWIRILDL
jgi:hypothetical protein